MAYAEPFELQTACCPQPSLLYPLLSLPFFSFLNSPLLTLTHRHCIEAEENKEEHPMDRLKRVATASWLDRAGPNHK